MKLVKAQVTNYRSVENSGEFTIDDMLCLVGKNEAGKTAILLAIAGLNPHPLTPITYDKERDYPRRFLTEYGERHSHDQAVVATTWWQPEANTLKLIADSIGPHGLRNEPVKVLRRYEATEAEWDPPIDYKEAVRFLIDQERLDEHECSGLSPTIRS
jgi:AAA ATPase-like protein